MQVILYLVFLVEAWLWARCLRPEISKTVRSSQFQANEMIYFILACRMMEDAICRVVLILFTCRDIAYGTGITRLANDGFGGGGDDIAGRTSAIGQTIMSLAPRRLALYSPVWLRPHRLRCPPGI